VSAADQRLLVISPVRNEQAHIERVASAVLAQTRPPDAWIVVDDASNDRTPRLLAALEAEIPFLSTLGTRAPDGLEVVPDRLAIAAEARAFNLALRSVPWRTFTHIAKLDGDIELPPSYFEELLAAFATDPRLGLAGGVYADPVPGRAGRWQVVRIPVEHHVPGALKCWSLPCLQAIGGVQERLGWDTIDETYARMHGFRTRALPSLVALHHRPWGSADGTLRGRARHGECAYVAQFPLAWVTLRAAKVARARPLGLSGVAFLYGYLRAAARRVERVQDRAFRRFVRRELRLRMARALLPTRLLP
jgi:poly-beta-1,6-N-acetyl-D-glucosamine synthase